MTSVRGRAVLALAGLALVGCEAPPPPSLAPALQAARLTFDRRPLNVVGAPSGRSDVVVAGAPGPASPPEAGSSAAATPRPSATAAATAAPTATPTAPPRRGGSGGGSTGGSARKVAGQVLGFFGAGPVPAPVAGAEVYTTDGRQGTTGADGTFSIAGDWPSDGTWLVVHPDYLGSTVVGVPRHGDFKLHLKSDIARATRRAPRPNGDTTFTVTGEVRDDAGGPLAGVAVTLHAEDGSYGIPARTDAAGRFTMTVVAHDDEVPAASFLAIDYDGRGWMGMSQALTLAAPGGDVDFEPADGDVDALRLAPMDHTLELAIDAGGSFRPPHTFLEMTLPWDEQVTAFVSETTIPVARAPGLTYAARVEVYTEDGRATAGWRQGEIALSAGATTTLAIDMLDPPAITSPAAAAGPLGTIAWGAVAGARGYEVRLEDPARSGFAWEAYALGTSVAFTVPAGITPPAGAYDLKVTAWDADGMAPREVASLDDRRALRLLPTARAYRYATTITRLDL